MSKRIVSVGVVVASSLVCVAPAFGATQTFTNSTAITVNANGNATPYPSTITVADFPGSITDVNVAVNGVTHPDISDFGAVVTGPSGTSFGLFNGIALFTGGAVNDLDLTMDDQAAGVFVQNAPPAASGSFKPRLFRGGSFPAPGPGFAYNTPPDLGVDTLNGSYAGSSPNGTWSLFVTNFDPGQAGTIARGWTLAITTDAADPVPPTDPEPTPTVITPPADTAKPTAQISKVTTKKGKKTAKLEFAGADNVTAAASLNYTCKLDQGTAAACTSPTIYRGLKFGKHTVEVRALDAAGNASDPATQSFKIKRKPKRH